MLGVPTSKVSNIIINQRISDLWRGRRSWQDIASKEVIVVDYKATSKDGEITLEDEWKDGYKRQMEIYQWLLRQNGLKVAKTGYFVYCNGLRAWMDSTTGWNQDGRTTLYRG